MSLSSLAVSVIVPCRDEALHIESCIRSILACDPPSAAFEVIVADGMSEDGTRDVLFRLAQEDSRLRIIDNPGRIASTGLNAAIRAARGDVVIRMDGHSEYAVDYIRQCVALLEHTGADNVGGPARTKAVGYLQRAIAAAHHSCFAVGGARFHNVDYEGPADTVMYGCWHRALFERIGLFDEELVRNQDDEFNLRITRAGGKIWQSPHIKLWYRPRSSLKSLFCQYMQYGFWKVRVIKKHKIPASFRHLVPGLFLATLIGSGCLAPFSERALWASVGLVGLYCVAVLVASIHLAYRTGLDLLPILPVVYWCYHFGYGYGTLRGLENLLLRKQFCHSDFTATNRNCERHVMPSTVASSTRAASERRAA